MDVSGPSNAIEIRNNSAPEVAFDFHQMRWQGMWGFTGGSPWKRRARKIGLTCPALSL